MINICLVGFKGYWAQNLVRAISKVDGIKLTARVDIDAERSDVPIPTFNKLSDAWTYCDVVVIATPPSTHYDLAMEAIKAHKHVLIEKPMTVNSEEAVLLNQASKDYNIKIGVDHTFLFSDHIRTIRALIEQGKIGKVLRIDSFRQNLGKFQDSGVVWDLMPHDIAMANYLMNDIPTVESVKFLRHLDKNVIDTAAVELKYKDSTYAISMSWLYPKKVRTTTVIGTEGMIEYDMLADKPIKIYDKKASKSEKAWLHSFNWVSEYQGECREPLQVLFEEFRDSLNNNTPFISNGQVGAEVVKIIEDTYSKEAKT
jgi:predicted dehydrogenase